MRETENTSSHLHLKQKAPNSNPPVPRCPLDALSPWSLSLRDLMLHSMLHQDCTNSQGPGQPPPRLWPVGEVRWALEAFLPGPRLGRCETFGAHTVCGKEATPHGLHGPPWALPPTGGWAFAHIYLFQEPYMYFPCHPCPSVSALPAPKRAVWSCGLASRRAPEVWRHLPGPVQVRTKYPLCFRPQP